MKIVLHGASGHLPQARVAIATSHRKAQKVLATSERNRTYFSPAAYFEPRERPGTYRLGTHRLLANDRGECRISTADDAKPEGNGHV